MTLGNFLFMLPFPVLLVILYRSDATLAVSARLKLATLATALIQGILITAPNVYGWILMLRQDWHAMQAFGLATHADNFRTWFHESTAWDQTWSLIELFAQMAFILFLVALLRYRNQPPESGVRQSHLLRETAALATITGGLGVILSIGRQVYAAVDFSKHQNEWEWLGGSTLGQFVVRNALSMIPDVCWLIAAFIVYRSQHLGVHDNAADNTSPAS